MKKTIVSLFALGIFFSAAAQVDRSKINNIPKELDKEVEKKDTAAPKVFGLFPLDATDLNNLFEIIRSGTVRLDLKPSQQDSIFNAYRAKIMSYNVPKTDTPSVKPHK